MGKKIEQESHSYPSLSQRIEWWVADHPVLRLLLLALVVSAGTMLVLAAIQAAYASDGEQTTVTLPLASFLGIIFGLISILVSGPVAWIIRGVMRDLKKLNEDHDTLKEKVLTEFVRRPDSARLETRIETMNTDLGVKLDRIFELIGDLERNKADKPPGHHFGGYMGG